MGDGVLLGALLVLALVDSTSIGTLVLPLLMLLAPRVHVRSYLLFLLTIAAAYAVVGVLLVSGAGWLTSWASGLGSLRWLRQVELAVGLALLAVGVFGDPRKWFGRSGPDPAQGRARLERWRDRLQGVDVETRGARGRYAAVVGIALVAVGIEIASMVPYLAAAGLIATADLPFAHEVVIVVGYCLVMIAPALVLLALRLLFAGLLRGPLTRLSDWMLAHSEGAIYWVLFIVGVILTADASDALTG